MNISKIIENYLVWPFKGDPMGAPVDASHSRTVLSMLPLASRVPSGLHETDTTQWSCPLSGHLTSNVLVS